jgi:hypothetical protein
LDRAANFKTWGVSRSRKYSLAGSNSWTRAFGNVMRICGSRSNSASQLASLVLQGVTRTTTNQQVTEYAVLVALRLVNSHSETTSADVACYSDLLAEGKDYAPCYELSHSAGFQMEGNTYVFACICKSCPLL